MKTLEVQGKTQLIVEIETYDPDLAIARWLETQLAKEAWVATVKVEEYVRR